MVVKHQLSKRLFDGDQSALGKHARDAQLIFDRIPVVEHRTVEQLYAEPLVLGQMPEEPFAIELLRVVNLYTPEQPVHAGGMVHFTWKPQQGGAVIANVDGMSPTIDGTTRFRFYYRITYKME